MPQRDAAVGSLVGSLVTGVVFGIVQSVGSTSDPNALMHEAADDLLHEAGDSLDLEF